MYNIILIISTTVNMIEDYWRSSGGHIPGALLFTQSVNQNKEGVFLDKTKLTELYKDIPRENTIILYCHRDAARHLAFSF